jgi:hypothetical protein
MDLASALHRLWRSKIWLIPVGAVAALAALAMMFRVSVFPPGLDSREFTYGSARAEVLVDSERSSLAAIEIPLSALSERAQVYAELLRSDAVRRRIGARAGVPWTSISVDGLTTLASPGTSPETTATERAAELLSEGAIRQVFFRATPEQPIIQITTQGQSAEEAVALANGTAQALPDYLDELQQDQGIQGPTRVALTQIGRASGGEVGNSTKTVLAILVGLATFALGCLAVLFVPRLVDGVRRAEEIEHRELVELLSQSNGAHAAGAPEPALEEAGSHQQIPR